MSHSQCAFDGPWLIWCLSSAIFWLTVFGFVKLILRRLERLDGYLNSWLPRFQDRESRKQPLKEFYASSGHFNLSYLKNEFPSTSSIYTIKDAHQIDDLINNQNDLRNLVNAFHANITYATGLFSRNSQFYMATVHSIRDDLKNFLADKSVRFSDNLIFSLVDDLTSGLSYLHYSPIRYHGKLNSVNCVITSTMRLKISNVGNAMLQLRQPKNEPYYFNNDFHKLYLAPEILRGNDSKGSSEADVYAFSILVHEIIHRKGPFNIYSCSYQSIGIIINNVCHPEMLHDKMKLCRPSIFESINLETGCPKVVTLCLEEAWSDDPAERPPIDEIYHRLSPLRCLFRKKSIPSHATASEASSKHQMIKNQRAKKLKLLNELVPSKVVPCLFHNLAVKPTSFHSVSVLFINICIYPPKVLYSEDEDYNPLEEHIKVFSDVCNVIDELTQAYDVCKVETVKETYVVASGMDVPDNEKESEIALFALHLCNLMQSEEFKGLFENKVFIKLGIHKGPVAAGVIGFEKPKFCLFGDTMNMAARLCTTSEKLKIQLSSQFHEAMQLSGNFESRERGMINIKGEGWHKTYWLTRSRLPFRITKK